MKLNKIVKLSAAVLLAVSPAIGVISGQANSQIVSAASKKAKLTHNAYVYNSKAKRVGKKVLKKGKTLKVLASKTIKGKKYSRIGSNQYVVTSNFAKISKKKTTKHKSQVESTNDNSNSFDDGETDPIIKDWNAKYGSGVVIEATKPSSEVYEVGLGEGEYPVPAGTRYYLPNASLTTLNAFGYDVTPTKYMIVLAEGDDGTTLAALSDFKVIEDPAYKRALATYNKVDDDHELVANKNATIYSVNNNNAGGRASYEIIDLSDVKASKTLKQGKPSEDDESSLLGLGKYNGEYYFVYAANDDDGNPENTGYAIKADDLAVKDAE